MRKPSLPEVLTISFWTGATAFVSPIHSAWPTLSFFGFSKSSLLFKTDKPRYCRAPQKRQPFSSCTIRSSPTCAHDQITAPLLPKEQPPFTFLRPRMRNRQSFVQNRSQRQKQFKVYCDLDGVLVDFESGIRRLFPDYSSLVLQQQECLDQNYFDIQALPRHTLWERVAADGSFFRDLPWTEHGKILWNTVMVPLQADILTGVPAYQRSRVEKYQWCLRELGVPLQHFDIDATYDRSKPLHQAVREKRMRKHKQDSGSPVHTVITCWSTQKHLASGPNAVLIDDRECLRPAWEAKGGIFIHHINLEYTLEQLAWHGIWHEEKVSSHVLTNTAAPETLRSTTPLTIRKPGYSCVSLDTLRFVSR